MKKKLLFLLFLAVGWCNAIMATNVPLDPSLGSVGGNVSFDKDASVFKWWTGTYCAWKIPCVSDLSEYTKLVVEFENPTQTFRIDLESNAGTQKIAVTDLSSTRHEIDLTRLTECDITSMKSINLNGNYTVKEDASADNPETVTIKAMYLVKPFSLDFDNNGICKVGIEDFVLSDGITLGEDNVITATKAGTVTLELGDVDFSNLASVVLDKDETTSPYIKIIDHANLLQTDGAGVNDGWYSSYANIQYTDENRAKSTNIKSIVYYISAPADGSESHSMKFNGITLTKNIIICSLGNEVCIKDMNWNTSNAITWDMNKICEDPLVGKFDNGNDSYVDLSQYNTLKLYLAEGAQATVRCRFLSETLENADGVGNDFAATFKGTYCELDLTQVKEKFGGKAYLRGIKPIQSWNTNFGDVPRGATGLSNVVVIDDNSVADFNFSGMGEKTTSVVEALATASIIDATALTNTTPITLEAANPNCLFIVDDAAKLTNAKNVLVTDGDAYTCANLELSNTAGFKAPAAFTATKATMNKTVAGGKLATIVAPFEMTVPSDVKAYQVNSVNGNNVVLTVIEGGKIAANTAVVIEATAAISALNGSGAVTATTGATTGLLTAAYDNNTYAPAGSYVMQTQEDKQAFYKVAADNTIKMTPFTSYLTVSAGAEANAEMFNIVFDGEVTGVDGVKEAAQIEAIYDAAGVKRASLSKGMNIVKMNNGKTIKMMVK